MRSTDLSPLTFDVTYNLRLVGNLKRWNSLCLVPDNTQIGRTRRSALVILRRAGFPLARFAGEQPTAGYRPGRIFVDDHFASSGMAPCLTGRPKVYRAVPYRG